MSDTENEIQPEKEQGEKKRRHRSRKETDSTHHRRHHRREKTTKEKRDKPKTSRTPVDTYGILDAPPVPSSHLRSLSQNSDEGLMAPAGKSLFDPGSSDSESSQETVPKRGDSAADRDRQQADTATILFDPSKHVEPGTPRFHTPEELYKTKPELKPKPPEALPAELKPKQQLELLLWESLVSQLREIDSIIETPSRLQRWRDYPSNKLQELSDHTLAWLQGNKYQPKDQIQFIFPVQNLLDTIHPLLFSAMPKDEEQKIRKKLNCFNDIRLAFEKTITANHDTLNDTKMTSAVYEILQTTLNTLRPYVLKIDIPDDLTEPVKEYFETLCDKLDTLYETTADMFEKQIETMKHYETKRAKHQS